MQNNLTELFSRHVQVLTLKEDLPLLFIELHLNDRVRLRLRQVLSHLIAKLLLTDLLTLFRIEAAPIIHCLELVVFDDAEVDGQFRDIPILQQVLIEHGLDRRRVNGLAAFRKQSCALQLNCSTDLL